LQQIFAAKFPPLFFKMRIAGILAKDLYEYKANIDAKRSQSLDELTTLTEEMALYEDN